MRQFSIFHFSFSVCKFKSSQKGFSVFEILVVITLFVVIVMVVNQSFFASIKGQNKSDATMSTKQNANYVVSVMERSLHSALQVTPCNATGTSINYLDENGKADSFSCTNGIVQQTLQGGSPQNLTTSDVTVSSCSFTCTPEGQSQTIGVTMTITKSGTNLSVDQTSSSQIQSTIRLRNKN